MCGVKVSKLYGFLFVFSYGLGVPLCGREPSHDLDFGPSKTFCDSDFCVCNDPYGRIRCRCPPEVQVEDVIVKSKGHCSLPPETTALSIDNCENVTVTGDAFAELKEVKSVTLSNIKELTIESGAFRWKGRGLRVNVSNVAVVPDVPSYAFAGRIDSVTFDGSYIGMIRAFAFSGIESARSVTLRNANVANVEAQAFKRCALGELVIADSQFNVIPSRFVFEVDVSDLFKLERTFVDVIRTSAFKIDGPRETVVVDNRIRSVHSEAFKMRTGGDVAIQNNRFTSVEREAFRGFSSGRSDSAQSGKPKFKFINNSVTDFEEKSFYSNATAFDPQYSRIMVEDACACDALELWRNVLPARRSATDRSDELTPFWCHLDKEGHAEFAPGNEFYQSHCITLTNSIFFFVLIIAATSISVLLVILFIVCLVQRRRKKWNLVPGGEPDGGKDPRGKAKEGKSGAPKAIIVPDGRTYRETEFHVIVEKVEPLDAGYTPCKVVRDRSRSQVGPK